ncbi:hypothetical protein BVF91_05170 [Thermoanaerobacterium sp. PSU-2]|uniref:LiaF transmembrane domain-containing protein n=1 Tax=Thermoanaerobacterium sp. PSU-2 TaxID=1930849 RepID=UPI000A14B40B|nr:DUF5668 domain-containing protein [Thermoanaerobacterium sp. PSU-2]ORX23576.1 hypothetical protein BVF91_05170 [Thermoanaerobacterium sp. PSU-2]
MGKKIIGIVLILLGLIYLNDNLGLLSRYGITLDMSNIWPLFILIPGIMMEVSYLKQRKNPEILVPGGILTSMGIIFYFDIFTNWIYSEYTWPLYILSVAIGLFQLYIVSRDFVLMGLVMVITAAVILSYVSILYNQFSIVWLNPNLIISIMIILLGLALVIRSRKK